MNTLALRRRRAARRQHRRRRPRRRSHPQSRRSTLATRACCCSARAARPAACSVRCCEAGPEYLEIANRNAQRAPRARATNSRRSARCTAAASTRSRDSDVRPHPQRDFREPAGRRSRRFRPASIGPTTLCYDMAYGKGDTAFTRWSKSAGAGRAERAGACWSSRLPKSFQLWRGVQARTPAPVHRGGEVEQASRRRLTLVRAEVSSFSFT